MNVFVTGAAGFVGVNLVRTFAAQGGVVHAMGRRPPDRATEAYAAEGGTVRWVVGDVTDADGLRQAVAASGASVVVHAAAVTFTGEQEKAQPARVFEVNAMGTLHALEAARLADAQRFVYVSSGGLYGPAPAEPSLDESTPLRTDNMYAVSKLASERLCGRYGQLTSMRVVVGRLGTAYGPMERTTASRSNLSAVTQALAWATDPHRPSRPMRVAGASIARDFVHVDDVAAAFLALATSPTLRHLEYNVGTPESAPLARGLDALAAALPGFAWEPVDEDDRPDLVQRPEQARAGMDVRRIRADTPWTTARSIEDGVRDTVAWTNHAAHAASHA